MAYGMPRSDVFTVLHPAIDSADSAQLASDPDSPSDPQLLSFRSGFWGLARIGPREPGSDCRLELRAELEGGGAALTELGRLEIGALPAKPAALDAPEPAAGPLVAICMATYNPPPALLRRQLESIRAQTHRNWVCVIRDDCSGPDRLRRAPSRRRGRPALPACRARHAGCGFYRNFERALALAPAAADYVALADQDDRWHPEKLETLLGRDRRRAARLQRRSGSSARRASCSRTRTGAGATQPRQACSRCWWPTRDGRRLAVPSRAARLRAALPAAQFSHFHDHWIALCARLAGRDRLRRPAALRLRAARGRRARPRGGQPHADAARPGGEAARGPTRARAPLAPALLRRLLPADPVHDDPRDAPAATA